jgi:hypothetical protein
LYVEGIELNVMVDTPLGVDVAIDSNEDGLAGVTELDAADAVDVPLALVAVTVNV